MRPGVVSTSVHRGNQGEVQSEDNSSEKQSCLLLFRLQHCFQVYSSQYPVFTMMEVCNFFHCIYSLCHRSFFFISSNFVFFYAFLSTTSSNFSIFILIILKKQNIKNTTTNKKTNNFIMEILQVVFIWKKNDWKIAAVLQGSW